MTFCILKIRQIRNPNTVFFKIPSKSILRFVLNKVRPSNHRVAGSKILNNAQKI